jgi:uncharacterized integral membrane protein
MNFKLIFKTLFVIAVLSLLVLMGMNNPNNIELRLPHFRSDWPTVFKQPAAIMYFGFFGVGFLAGTIVMAGGGKRSTSKSEK